MSNPQKKNRRESILNEVDKSLAKTYKYKNPKTGQVFEYKRPGIYKDDDGTSLVKIWDWLKKFLDKPIRTCYNVWRDQQQVAKRKEIAVKSFCYESLMDLMEKAESLGWVDDFEDETGNYNSYVTDQIEIECLDVLRDNGYNVIERMGVSL